MKKLLSLLIISAFIFPIFAKISFGPSDLNENDEVLFTLSQEMTGINTYSSLFYTRIKNGESEAVPSLLTCYPERMELISGGNVLQLRNRYGTGLYNILSNTFSWKNVCKDIPENTLPVAPYSVSSDGKYICKIEKFKSANPSLLLQSVETDKVVELCDNVRQNYDSIPVKWASDSSILIYEKEGSLYFCNPEAVLKGIEMDEKYRKIGRGSINSVNWANERTIIYIDDYLVYQINSKELYTVGLYSGIIGQGKAIGRLPVQFNSLTDRFSVNSNVSALILNQNNRLFSYLKFQNKNCDYLDVIYSKPYIDSTSSLVAAYVLWDAEYNPYIWFEKLPFNGSKEKASVYMISTRAVSVLEIADANKPCISPDGTKIAYWAGGSIYVYDTSSWKRLAELAGEKVVSAIWTSKTSLMVGGEKTIRKWDLKSGISQTVLLSSAENGYWADSGKTIVADTGSENYYSYDKAAKIWRKTSPIVPKQSLENGRYRIFEGTTPNKRFENALYVRTVSRKAVTKPLYKQSTQKVAAPKKVALVIDAYDNADGLTNILSVLKKYNVKATFFLNGEFIRRYPSETKQIVNNGFECASMFFSPTDLVDNPFVVDENFIRRGLARNEDEFYTCTNKELSLYWHAPYYSVDPKLIRYGEAAGYTYINSLQTINDTEKLNKEINPEEIIQSYCDTLKRTSGGIVPVAAGFSQGNRTDPLYNYLDILICALCDNGFEFVGVDEIF